MSRLFRKTPGWGISSRSGRSNNVVDPLLMRKALIKNFEYSNGISKLASVGARTG